MSSSSHLDFSNDINMFRVKSQNSGELSSSVSLNYVPGDTNSPAKETKDDIELKSYMNGGKLPDIVPFSNEPITSVDTHIDASELRTKINALHRVVNGTSHSGFEEQYEVMVKSHNEVGRMVT